MERMDSSNYIEDVVLIVVPDVHNPFYVSVIEGINEIIEMNQLKSVVYLTREVFEKERSALKFCKENHLKGIIMISCAKGVVEQQAIVDMVGQIQCPIVFVDREYIEHALTGVFFNHYEGAYAGTKQLIQDNYNRFGVILGDKKMKHGIERQLGFERAIKEQNGAAKVIFEWFGRFDEKTGMEAAEALLDMEQKRWPQALFFANNAIMYGFVQHFLKLNKTVALKKFKIFSFDYVEKLDVVGLKYYFVYRNIRQMGEEATRILLELNQTDQEAPVRLLMDGIIKTT